MTHDQTLKFRSDEAKVIGTSPDVQLVTVKAAQRILSIGRSKTFQLMAQGKLERRYIDGCTRITMKSVMAFVEGK